MDPTDPLADTNAPPGPTGTPPFGCSGDRTSSTRSRSTSASATGSSARLEVPNPALEQTNPEFKKPTELKWADANFSPEERRANHPKYYYAAKGQVDGLQGQGAEHAYAEEPRGKKRARAEDFL
ncbi:hypothetical protein NMY22_g4969 [Coprinellus aureogranulatus]|nr:hypothetical protein NMY22_g4969 [Coprinellus aureogranulatus]